MLEKIKSSSLDWERMNLKKITHGSFFDNSE